jgi:hypothetical protein
VRWHDLRPGKSVTQRMNKRRIGLVARLRQRRFEIRNEPGAEIRISRSSSDDVVEPPPGQR